MKNTAKEALAMLQEWAVELRQRPKPPTGSPPPECFQLSKAPGPLPPKLLKRPKQPSGPPPPEMLLAARQLSKAPPVEQSAADGTKRRRLNKAPPVLLSEQHIPALQAMQQE